jgi:diguanylate cyclase
MATNISTLIHLLSIKVIKIIREIRMNGETFDSTNLKKYLLRDEEILSVIENSRNESENIIEDIKTLLRKQTENFRPYLSEKHLQNLKYKINHISNERLFDDLTDIIAILGSSYKSYDESIKRINSFFKDFLERINSTGWKLLELTDENIKILEADNKDDSEVLNNIKSIHTLMDNEESFEKLKNEVIRVADKINVLVENKIAVKSKKQTAFRKNYTDISLQLESYKEKYENIKSELDKYKTEAMFDELTGLYRKKYMFRIFEELSASESKQMPFIIVMTDLDDFKHINDTYGHNAGDHVIKHFAQIIKKISGSRGTAFRYGGEEFVIAFEDITFQKACELIDDIRLELSKTKFKLKNNKISITASFGLAVHKHDEAPEETLERADKNLYKAKNNGKNRIYAESKFFQRD